jgi:hypothetical protein
MTVEWDDGGSHVFKKFNFFKKKFNMLYMFWIVYVLILKKILKNKKISLTCISIQKII